MIAEELNVALCPTPKWHCVAACQQCCTFGGVVSALWMPCMHALTCKCLALLLASRCRVFWMTCSASWTGN